MGVSLISLKSFAGELADAHAAYGKPEGIALQQAVAGGDMRQIATAVNALASAGAASTKAFAAQWLEEYRQYAARHAA